MHGTAWHDMLNVPRSLDPTRHGPSHNSNEYMSFARILKTPGLDSGIRGTDLGSRSKFSMIKEPTNFHHVWNLIIYFLLGVPPLKNYSRSAPSGIYTSGCPKLFTGQQWLEEDEKRPHLAARRLLLLNSGALLFQSLNSALHNGHIRDVSFCHCHQSPQ